MKGSLTALLVALVVARVASLQEPLSALHQDRRVLGYNKQYNYSDAYGTNFFVDSQSTYYDGYQQSWRYLGHLVKCGYPSDRYDDDGDSHDSGDHDSGGSGGSGDGRNRNRKLSGSQDNNRYGGNNYCQRYLLWAAYVDLNYQGGGIGEYEFFDAYSEEWDASACETHGNGRCVPMDCHLANTTTWTLMGVYKEAEYFGNDAFFEQLFKHEGICIWNDEDLYDFMSDARESAWPEGCASTGQSAQNAYGEKKYLYLDLKPTFNGNMTYGLYEDAYCKDEYFGNKVTVEQVAANMGLLYGDYLDAWNEALEVYKVCQPCKAYNLMGDTYQYSDGGDGQDDSYSDPNEGYFQCDDEADYTNVNQCMKFRSHAALEVATWEDLVIATEQGGILEINISGTVFGTEKMSHDEQLYMKAIWDKEISEEAKYTKLIKSVPSAKPTQRLGNFMSTFGPASLVASLLWVLWRRLGHFCNFCPRKPPPPTPDLDEPLVEPTDSQVAAFDQ